MNSKQLLHQVKHKISQLDAQLLLATVLMVERSYVLAHPEQELTVDTQQAFMVLVERCQQGEPMAYILGQQEFWSLQFMITPDVLIPRPETELLVETVLHYFSADEIITIADVGTGSGAIALALAHERAHWNIIAADNSAAALAVAQQNAKNLQLTQVEFIQSDWCLQLPQHNYAAIISNPPYIASDDAHLAALHYEPQCALVADDNGLADIKMIAQQAMALLQPGGLLVFEHGFQQADAVQHILRQLGYQQIQTLTDLATLPRLTMANLAQ